MIEELTYANKANETVTVTPTNDSDAFTYLKDTKTGQLLEFEINYVDDHWDLDVWDVTKGTGYEAKPLTVFHSGVVMKTRAARRDKDYEQMVQNVIAMIDFLQALNPDYVPMTYHEVRGSRKEKELSSHG